MAQSSNPWSAQFRQPSRTRHILPTLPDDCDRELPCHLLDNFLLLRPARLQKEQHPVGRIFSGKQVIRNFTLHKMLSYHIYVILLWGWSTKIFCTFHTKTGKEEQNALSSLPFLIHSGRWRCRTALPASLWEAPDT